MTSKEFAPRRIKSLLQQQGKSYQQLSDETGISILLIESILSGERMIKPERLVTIAKALNVEVKDLVKLNCAQKGPLKIVFNGELTNRKSKRAFEEVLFAIEDYVVLKNQ